MRSKLVASGLTIAIALMATSVRADVKAGVDAWSRGDYPAAIKEWRPLAINGDADAQFNLGQAYKLGRGVPVDFKLAEGWYRKAADQGHFQAEDNLGLILFQNGDRPKALPYIEKSAGRGEPRAQYVLATALFNGDLAKKDWVRAYALMTRASASGLSQASGSLSQMDQFIPLEQRQKGLAMARNLEAAEQRPQFAEAPAVKRPPRVPEPPIRVEDIPASSPEPKMPDKPVKVAMVEKPSMMKPKSTAPAPAPIAGPAWRVQLGAFGDQGNARALWSKLLGRFAALGGLQPYFVKAGNVTRLQAGPIAGKVGAERVCASLKASGQGCLVVGP
ncbi:MAG: SPOR domain-containing protein [Pseudomonadota bacterium]